MAEGSTIVPQCISSVLAPVLLFGLKVSDSNPITKKCILRFKGVTMFEWRQPVHMNAHNSCTTVALL